uniref:Holocytochrome c-type synthase n=1 Tax=Parascaris univalens TaxID=6257 RepID=A0A914ZNJ2_PARUN
DWLLRICLCRVWSGCRGSLLLPRIFPKGDLVSTGLIISSHRCVSVFLSMRFVAYAYLPTHPVVSNLNDCGI